MEAGIFSNNRGTNIGGGQGGMWGSYLKSKVFYLPLGGGGVLYLFWKMSLKRHTFNACERQRGVLR